MPIPQRETFPTDRPDLTAQITDDGSVTLVRTGTEDAFHSGCGAASETRHVYLENSGIGDRLRRGEAVRVLEIGLGTSMAMLMTVDLAVGNDAPLCYVACEPDWIAASTMAYLKPQGWVDRQSVVERYLNFRRSLPDRPTSRRYRWRVDERRKVVVFVGDVMQMAFDSEDAFDAIFFDPFCPHSAPQLWTEQVFARMRRIIAAEGSLTTYSCSRVVRDAMAMSGWHAARVAGPPGGKRDVLIARPI